MIFKNHNYYNFHNFLYVTLGAAEGRGGRGKWGARSAGKGGSRGGEGGVKSGDAKRTQRGRVEPLLFINFQYLKIFVIFMIISQIGIFWKMMKFKILSQKNKIEI